MPSNSTCPLPPIAILPRAPRVRPRAAGPAAPAAASLVPGPQRRVREGRERESSAPPSGRRRAAEGGQGGSRPQRRQRVAHGAHDGDGHAAGAVAPRGGGHPVR
eukprot:9177556-Pyramimonas_sp.AAC.1